MTHPCLCPRCGHNLEADQPIKTDEWLLDPYAGRATYGRVLVTRRASHVLLLHAVAAVAPGVISAEALLNRVSRSEKVNMIYVMFSQMKRKWPQGVPWPIERVFGLETGYRWVL